MTHAQWFLLVGGLLLAMGLTSSVLKRLPITPAIIYLAVGILIGPSGLNVFHFNPLKDSALLEALTEVVVLISLFSAGVKMPVPFKVSRWHAPIMLATVSMAVSVGLVAAFAYFVMDLPWGAGVLLGAILAPTDPVLATDVQSRHPGDHDRLRFTLTAEAGMNDGSAFPFVMLGLGLLGLHDLGDYGLHWFWVDVIWATVAAIAIGVASGAALAWASFKLRNGSNRHELMDDFLGLGLIGVVYGLCVVACAWGFLAVFFAAVALRQTELRLNGMLLHRPLASEPAHRVSADSTEHSTHGAAIESLPTVSGGSLVFKEHLERLSEVILILLVGGTLFQNSWNWRVVVMAMFLFIVARPLSVMIGLLASRTAWRARGMMGWFGVRGIGSLYYLMYAIQHGLPQSMALTLIQFTLIAVTLSIIVHGVSVKPMMNRFAQR
ncbi:MAG: cation:proton antiporter [Halothiobacillus sp.]